MKPIFILISKEIKDIFFSRTAVLFFILTSFIIGNSFVMAIDLYSKASSAAVDNPLYASGFEPTPGVFIPVYGGLFIFFSLFLSFVIIPIIGNEKKNNTLSLLTQLPFGFKSIIISKVIASIFFLSCVLAITFPSFMIWKSYGGHIAYLESFILGFGYLLYGFLIVSIAFCFAALFESTANAAILSIAIIITSWVVDFTKSSNASSIISFFSDYTFTKMLKPFESGIFSLRDMLFFVLLSVSFLSLSYIFLRFDIKHKWKCIVSLVVTAVIILFFINKINVNVDVTESHRNSFAPNIVKTLKKVPALSIDVYLKKTDSRYKDYEHDFLSKLKLIRTDVNIKMMEGEDLDNNYGLFVYKVNNKEESTYSNSEEEIFPIIFGLSGQQVKEDKVISFSGYPLVINSEKLEVIRYFYYLILPFLFLLSFIIIPRIFNTRRFKHERN